MNNEQPSTDQVSPSHSKRMGAFAGLLLLLLILANGAWFYINQQSQTDAANKQAVLDSLQSKIATLNQQASTAKVATGLYEIPELGIKFKLDNNIKDLTYAYDQKLKTAAFYSRNLTYLAAVDNKTDTYSLSEAQIGFVQVETAIPACQTSCPTDVLKLSNGKHVLYTHIQAPGSTNSATIKLMGNIISSLETSLKNAQPL